ncbi:hypothetical protein [Paenibacillus residui]|uniref:Uncharacterized protein n=1 Tax=Paenibacillus residui TaxID=629724 RepID=A0ABW3D6H1_9BACL
MAEQEFYRLDLVIGTDGVEGAEKQLKAMDKMLEHTERRAAALGKSKINPKATLKDKVSSIVQQITGKIRRLNQTNAKPTATLRDRVSGPAQKIRSFMTSLSRAPYTVVIQAKDMVTGTIKKITGMLTSPLAALGVGGGIAGTTAFGLNIVMGRQSTTTAFDVLLGSIEAAEERMEELIAFAGRTPYKRDEIFQSSRILEVFTKGKLSVGEELTRIGDIAAGTQNEFADVALWMGRLYDAMQSGRPVGAMTSRLQEMGAISGDARARIEALSELGVDISRAWPLATKEFARFDGMMEKMSGNLQNLLLGTKTFFTENVFFRWGKGVSDAITPALKRFREWRSENKETVAKIGQWFEELGKNIGTSFVNKIEGMTTAISQLRKNPEFQNADFWGKLKIAWDELVTKPFSEWWASGGEQRLREITSRIGEVLGGGAKGLIMGGLSLFVKDDDIKDPNPYVQAGKTAGKAFFESFIEAFDAKAIANKAAEAFKNIQPTWLGGESSGMGSIAALLFDVWLASKIYKMGKKPAKFGKGIWDWMKGMLGKSKNAGSPDSRIPSGRRGAPGEKTSTAPRGGSTTPTNSKPPVQANPRSPNDPNLWRRYQTPTKWAKPPKPSSSPANPMANRKWIGKYPKWIRGFGLPLAIGNMLMSSYETSEKLQQNRAQRAQEFSEIYKDNPAMLQWGAKPTHERMSVVNGINQPTEKIRDVNISVLLGTETQGLLQRVMNFQQEKVEKTWYDQTLSLGGINLKKAVQKNPTVQISDQQVDQISSLLKNIKNEVKNEYQINIPVGAVQLNVKEEMDYEEVSNQIGGRVARALTDQLKRAMENRN